MSIYKIDIIVRDTKCKFFLGLFRKPEQPGEKHVRLQITDRICLVARSGFSSARKRANFGRWTDSAVKPGSEHFLARCGPSLSGGPIGAPGVRTAEAY